MTSSASKTAELVRQVGAALEILAPNIPGPEEKALGLAISGGSDSTALLVLAAEWCAANGIRAEAVTVDHGLRAAAREEAETVARLCRDLRVPHTILTWDRSADRSGAVAQAEARDARHALMADWAAQRGLGVLALGHTRDDRIETFLMRVRAGSGWRGLAGPMPSAASPAWPSGRGLRLIRPLLAFGREELREMLRERNLGWAEDPSNLATRFERVRMRTLAGQMAGQTLDKTLRVMDGLALMRSAVLAEARAALARTEIAEDTARIDIDLLRALGPEARLRLVEALVMAAGGASTPPRGDALKRAVERLCGASTTLTGLTLGGAWLRRDQLALGVCLAPARRGETAGTSPIWDRAAGLLSDPRVEALSVRGDSHGPDPAFPGEKDAGK
ncbi:MAG TPA: tRNA lysidine(34) synthetase TilS [Hyphomonadaceae bacterium]|nr:tRNA lysidine(34) synthetase TilS [Hyphomonadaceae bacterium]